MEVGSDPDTPGYMYHSEDTHQGEKDLSSKCSKSADIIDSTSSKSETACFDCYICLDLVVEPVVTLCGHLYCWPCIYKWLQLEPMSSRQCPVCKSPLSRDTVIRLYGRSGPSKKSESKIPFRSSLHHQATKASVLEGNSIDSNRQEVYNNANPSMQQPLLGHSYPYHPPHSSVNNLDTAAAASSLLASPFFHLPAWGLVGGLFTSFLPWAFRDQGVSMYNTRRHQLMLGGESPRSRRYQMQVESSLQQTWLLLLFFAIVCLIFF